MNDDQHFETTGNNYEQKKGGDDTSRNRSVASIYTHTHTISGSCKFVLRSMAIYVAAEMKFPSINYRNAVSIRIFKYL